MYSEQVWEHFRKPRNRGALKDPDGVGKAFFPRCGDKMILQLRIVDSVIEQARFVAAGCGPVIAAGSAGTEMLRGLTVDEARQFSSFELNAALGGLPIAKRHALLMFLECLHEALGAPTTSKQSNEMEA